MKSIYVKNSYVELKNMSELNNLGEDLKKKKITEWVEMEQQTVKMGSL